MAIRRKRAPRKTAAKRKTAPRKKTNLKKVIKQVLHSQIENKLASTFERYKTITSYVQTPGLYVQSMIPYSNIVQGLGQSDRIGCKIRTMKCIFNYVITPYPKSAVLNNIPMPQNVIIFFGKVKNSKPQPPIASDFAKLYQFGNTVAVPQGDLMDQVLSVNKDWFTVYKTITHKIGFENYNTSSLSPTFQHFTNNDYKLNAIGHINLTKYCPKNVIFNDTTSEPTNDGLFMWAMSVPANGTTQAELSPVVMSSSIHYEYEDA